MHPEIWLSPQTHFSTEKLQIDGHWLPRQIIYCCCCCCCCDHPRHTAAGYPPGHNTASLCTGDDLQPVYIQYNRPAALRTNSPGGGSPSLPPPSPNPPPFPPPRLEMTTVVSVKRSLWDLPLLETNVANDILCIYIKNAALFLWNISQTFSFCVARNFVPAILYTSTW